MCIRVLVRLSAIILLLAMLKSSILIATTLLQIYNGTNYQCIWYKYRILSCVLNLLSSGYYLINFLMNFVFFLLKRELQPY